MRLRIIVPIEYFEIENNGKFKHRNFTITNGNVLGKELAKDKKFVKTFGLHKIEFIKINYVFLAELEIIGFPHTILDKYAQECLGYLLVWINWLWLIRDNSCFVNHLFIQDLDGTYSRTWLKDTINSNASDSFPKTTFTIEEISKYEAYFDEIRNFVLGDINIPRLNAVNPTATMIDVPINHVTYNYNRIFRALLFVSFARKTGILILKITFFMAAYECLFTSNNERVTNRVTNRSSRFLGGTDQEIDSNRALVNEAYNIRSLYFHGEKIHITPDDLKILSIKIDELTRKIMKKVMINSPENAIFTIEEDEAGKVVFEAYFQGLIHD